jgi:hypothetical protein
MFSQCISDIDFTASLMFNILKENKSQNVCLISKIPFSYNLLVTIMGVEVEEVGGETTNIFTNTKINSNHKYGLHCPI